MPNNGKRFNKNHNRYRHQSDDGIQKSYHHNGGGGVNGHNNNRNNNKHYGNGNNRKYIFNPSIISSLDDDDFDHNSNSNGFNNNNNNKHSHKNDHKKSNKDRRKMVDRLKDMGLAKSAAPKLSIGDSDSDVKKNLIESKPHCQISNLPTDVFDLIVNYVQNYFTCFDTKREDLLAAYNPKCTFSLTLNMGNNQNSYRSFKYDDYILRENRNLKRIVGNENHHRDKRFQLQHRGYIDTLSVLCKLPATEHDPRSFKLDISFFSPNMITFSLGGVFKEGKQSDKVRPLRSFHRVFVCIPDPNSQMTIVNEQFIIGTITQDQFKLYYDTSKQQQQQQQQIDQQQDLQQATTSSSSSNGTSNTLMPGLNEQQTEMIKEFSNKSRLNIEWSKYCLEHASWNFEEAAKVFIQFKESIPVDAFLN